MACLAADRSVLESHDGDRTSARPRAAHRPSKRALFSGSDEVPHGGRGAVEDAHKRADGDVSSDAGGSESEFEPSDADSQRVSSEDDDAPLELPRASRKRKRVARRPDSTSATGSSFDVCRLCDDVFASPMELLAHREAPHPFVCDIEGCGRRFADEARAIDHVHAWHDVQEHARFVCGVCDTFHLTRHDLRLHCQQSAHAMEEPPRRLFVCTFTPTCRQAYKKKDKFMQHQRRYHEPSEDGAAFDCDRCDASFCTRHERGVHLVAAHPGLSSMPHTPCFACDFVGCGKSYSKREHLRRHVLATHDAPQEKPFGCELCGVRFVYKHALTRHHTNCHTTDVEKPYACSVCLLAFKKKSLLQAHSFVHTGVLPFECEDCGERFLKRFQLVRHARKHANTRPSQAQVFMCDYDDCGELLFSLDEKRDHMRDAHGITIKEEPEAPKRSGKRRARRGSEDQHRGGGTARELRCLVCNQVFARIQNLRSHLRTHFEALDERKLHACPMDGCSKAYTKKSNLMAHYNAAHDPVKSTRFKCPFDGCDGAFGYKKVLQTHIASIHQRIKKEEMDTAASHGEEHAEQDDLPVMKRRKGRDAMGVLPRVLGLDEKHATGAIAVMSESEL